MRNSDIQVTNQMTKIDFFSLIFSFPTETNRKDGMYVVLPCIISTENTNVP